MDITSMHRIGTKLFAGCFATVGLGASVHADGSFYCQSRIISIGAAPYDVRSLCGTPDDTQQRTETRSVQRRVTVPCAAGYCSSFVEDTITVQVEEWTYDFGKQRFMQHLTFEGGKLVRIRTGSYGRKLESDH